MSEITTSFEFGKLLDEYPDIDEVEFEALTPFVMEYYLQSYEDGNDMDMEGEKLRYLSKRFILVGTKLGCATAFVPEIVRENMPIIKQFREQYQPFMHDYEITYEGIVTVVTNNIFAQVTSSPVQIEEYLNKGAFKLKWIKYDRNQIKKPEVCYDEIKVQFLRQVLRAAKQVILIKGMDPTIISVFHDMVEFERKMIYKTSTKKKEEEEMYLRKITLDSFLRKQLWHIGLVVLKLRKAAKAWHLRLEMIKKFSSVDRFIVNPPSSRQARAQN